MATAASLQRGKQLLAQRSQGGIAKGSGSAYSPGKNDSIWSLFQAGGLDPNVLNALAFHGGPQLHGVGGNFESLMRSAASQNVGVPDYSGAGIPHEAPAPRGSVMGGLDSSLGAQRQQDSWLLEMERRRAEMERQQSNRLLEDRMGLFKKLLTGGGFNLGKTSTQETTGSEYHNIGGRPVAYPTRQRSTVQESGIDAEQLMKLLFG